MNGMGREQWGWGGRVQLYRVSGPMVLPQRPYLPVYPSPPWKTDQAA
jgi:hypothetical protein